MDKICIIEDDFKLCELVKEYLEDKGYYVYIIDDFINIEEEISKENPKLILLDINLPYVDGYYVCRDVRSKSNIPIIIISARSGEKDQILAIDLGADDYVTKPFKLEILHSKIKAVLRRTYGEYACTNKYIEEKVLYLDEKKFTINFKDRVIELTKNELKIINKFLLNPGKVIKRAAFFQELWDEDTFIDENTLTVNITRIKNIFKALGIKDIIKTKRGVGYIFDDTVIKEVKGNEEDN
ncbi:MAG: response regulator transcription factor [Clostridium sp.]|uniref:response regulator transcription factor n=1 Tax=Clostridium sp. TaxID=1506 RepID=UPI003D6C8290